MSMRPIDMQTLFVRLSELSRNQAALHDGQVQKHAVDLEEQAEDAIAVEERVNHVEEVEGPESLGEGEERRPEHESPRQHQPRKTAPVKEEVQKSAEVIRDPSLGSSIDIEI